MTGDYHLPWNPSRYISPSKKKEKEFDEPRQYISFTIPLKNNNVITNITDFQENKIKEFNTYPINPRDLHITLKYVEIPYEIVPSELINDIKPEYNKITEVANPFEVQVKNVNVFDNCVFAEIGEGKEELIQWNRQLTEIDTIPTSQYDHPNYHPHVTIAFFDDIDIHKFLSRIAAFRCSEIEFGSFTVEEINITVDRIYEEKRVRYNTIDTISFD